MAASKFLERPRYWQRLSENHKSWKNPPFLFLRLFYLNLLGKERKNEEKPWGERSRPGFSLNFCHSASYRFTDPMEEVISTR